MHAWKHMTKYWSMLIMKASGKENIQAIRGMISITFLAERNRRRSSDSSQVTTDWDTTCLKHMWQAHPSMRFEKCQLSIHCRTGLHRKTTEGSHDYLQHFSGHQIWCLRMYINKKRRRKYTIYQQPCSGSARFKELPDSNILSQS